VARTIAKDHDQKRQMILTSSARLFAVEGYGRATMSQIAGACGVSKANIYHYYDGKEALLFDILDTHLCALRDDICGLTFASDDPKDQLFEIISALLLSYQGSDAAHRVQINALSVLPQDQQRILRQYQRDLVTFVQTRIAAILGAPKSENPAYLRDITMSLFAMVNWHFLWDGAADADRRRSYAATICQLICQGS
jgi:AcrR family transcriptional regulator